MDDPEIATSAIRGVEFRRRICGGKFVELDAVSQPAASLAPVAVPTRSAPGTIDDVTRKWAEFYFMKRFGAIYRPSISDRFETVAKAKCDSPIEQRMLAILMTCGSPLPIAASEPEAMHILRGNGNLAVIVPQAEVGRFRADFMLYALPRQQEARWVIECDGKEFHTTTKQLENDKKRAAYLAEQGIRILRFTGSEIYRSPDWCRAQICEATAKVFRA